MSLFSFRREEGIDMEREMAACYIPIYMSHVCMCSLDVCTHREGMGRVNQVQKQERVR